tara:strand:- start:242 stop:1609 length:1368 start_codon:yes stop_codon:yes gene_type:complete
MDIIQGRIDRVLQLQNLLFSEGTNTATPILIAREMINDYPAKMFTDPKETFVDKHCGIGTELIAIIERLNKELRDVIKDDTARIKHIIENQIFGWEINKSRYQSTVACLKEIAGADIAVNIKNSNVLAEEEEFKMKQFTLDVGNPPFNDESGDARDASQNSNNSVHYIEFVKLGFPIEYLKSGSKYLKFPLPGGWTMKVKDVTLFQNNGLKSVKFKSSSVFPNVKIRTGVTIVEFEKSYKGDITITTTSGETYTQSRTDPIQDVGVELKSLLSNIWKASGLNGKVTHGDYQIPKGTKGDIEKLVISCSTFNKTQTSKFNTNVLIYSGGEQRPASYLWSSEMLDSTNGYKVTWPKASDKFLLGKVRIMKPGEGVSSANYYIKCKTLVEAKKWVSWLEHKLVRLSVKIRKTNDTVNTYNNCMNYIPVLPDCDINDDSNLIKYFNYKKEQYGRVDAYI